MRVLVVDDSADMVDSEATLLELWGYEVHIARDGLEAVDAAHQHLPDVILLDIDLPRLNGWEVARRLRQSDGLKNVLLLAMSGYGQASDRRRSDDAGFDYHLLKPFDPSALRHLLAIYEAEAKQPAAFKIRVATEKALAALEEA